MTKKNQQSLGLGGEKKSGPVECLGQTFPSDEKRREHYLKLLAEKLKDPEFRKTPGFPKGSDEDILRLSDPPYYTACPNPFLGEFVQVHGKPYDPSEDYRREPFAVDVTEGKHDAIYKAHSLHTKVPHLAIVPSILHYTAPGDLVLDGFSGSGMTGVACLWCGSAPAQYRAELEHAHSRDNRPRPEWAPRHVILGDLAPTATFVASNYTLPCDLPVFSKTAARILREVEEECGWMYQTTHQPRGSGVISFTVWSEVFSCPECSGEIVFFDQALDPDSKRTTPSFPCPHCNADLTKDNLARCFESSIDSMTGQHHRRIKFKPVAVSYNAGRTRCEKPVDNNDRQILQRIAGLQLPPETPLAAFPLDRMYHGSRLGPKGFTHIHHMFFPRSLHVLAAYVRRARLVPDVRLRNALLILAQHQYVNASVMNRYRPASSFGNSPLTGVYYVSSLVAEANVISLLQGSVKRVERMGASGWQGLRESSSGVCITTASSTAFTDLADNSMDYVFTDPPFGENIFYADMNLMVDAWHGITAATNEEAIVDKAKGKGLAEYQLLMQGCFDEYFRLLKPGRWMTVVFSNSSNAVWRTIQEAIGRAGFVVADVRTLDKGMGSYRQVTSSAVKQDLVISAYKPTEVLTRRFSLGVASSDGVWAFVGEHLRNVPVFIGIGGQADIVGERTAQMLNDRVVAFHVQRGLAVPLGSQELFAGLEARYPKREGMYFLSDQVAEYDRKRTSVGELRQLELFVSDEASATQWIRQQLDRKPQTFQELQPQFMQHLQAWAKHEKTIELREILTLNFFCYDGKGPVPSQIHSYLSTNFKDLRNLEKDDPALKAKAEDRWYVPDPSKEGDLDKLRLRTLLKEFEDYRASTGRKLKQFRTEAVRAGFKHCYDNQDYQTIVDVAAKLPELVIQEDEKLLMYFDVATMRLGKE